MQKLRITDTEKLVILFPCDAKHHRVFFVFGYEKRIL